MSPFIVTTKRPQPRPPGIRSRVLETVSRRAVATLEEAQEESRRASTNRIDPALGLALATLPESGGTVGPLPDGTVIEVEATTWQDMALAAGLTFPASVGNRAEDGDAKPRAEILDAFNARQDVQRCGACGRRDPA